MSTRADTLTMHLRRYDSKLYANREFDGGICVYRNSPHGDQFVTALTDNWTIRGRPVDWGIDPLIHRIQEIDSWNRGVSVDELLKGYERDSQSKERHRKNQHEAWLYDNRSMFKKAFNDINTSNLNVKSRGNNHGNYQ